MHTSVLKLVYIGQWLRTCFFQPSGHRQGSKVQMMNTLKIMKLSYWSTGTSPQIQNDHQTTHSLKVREYKELVLRNVLKFYFNMLVCILLALLLYTFNPCWISVLLSSHALVGIPRGRCHQGFLLKLFDSLSLTSCEWCPGCRLPKIADGRHPRKE